MKRARPSDVTNALTVFGAKANDSRLKEDYNSRQYLNRHLKNVRRAAAGTEDATKRVYQANPVASYRQNPEIRLLLQRAEEYIALNALDRAEMLLLQIVADKPYVLEAYGSLSLIAEERGNDRLAFEMEMKRLDASFEHAHTPDQLYRAAILAERIGLKSDAVLLYARVLKKNPLDAKACVGKSRVLLDLGRLVEAVETCEQLLDVYPLDLKLKIACGVANRRAGFMERAQSLLMDVGRIALSPTPEDRAGPARPRQRVKPDEEEILKDALCAVSHLVDLRMERAEFEEAIALLARCNEFLRNGESADPTVTWSWSLLHAPNAATRPPRLPYDLAVKLVVCHASSVPNPSKEVLANCVRAADGLLNNASKDARVSSALMQPAAMLGLVLSKHDEQRERARRLLELVVDSASASSGWHQHSELVATLCALLEKEGNHAKAAAIRVKAQIQAASASGSLESELPDTLASFEAQRREEMEREKHEIVCVALDAEGLDALDDLVRQAQAETHVAL